MHLGIKDVSTSLQRRIKDVRERLWYEFDLSLIFDYLVITLSTYLFFIW